MDNVSGGLPNIGKTYHGGTPTSVGRSVELEGTCVTFRDEVKSGSAPATIRSGRFKKCILVRNTSGAALAPKRLVTWESGYRGRRVSAYADVAAEEVAGVVDDRLPASGVADDDLFWLIVGGPALVKTANAGASAVIAEGDVLVALTAGTTADAGRLGVANTASTALAASVSINRIGRAMSAATTANTNSDLLVDVQLLN